MGSKKLTHVHIYAAAGVVLLIVGVAFYFLDVRPRNQKIATLEQEIQTALTTPVNFGGDSTLSVQNVEIAEQQIQAGEELLAEKQAERASREAELRRLEARKQLPSGQQLFIAESEADKLRRTLPRWLNLPKPVIERTERFAKQLAKRHGVKVMTVFSTKAPSTNLASIPTDVVAWRLGRVTVIGDFNKVMRWAEGWNDAPLLSSLDNLRCTLANEKGEVVATGTVNVYVFPTGPGATIPSAGGAGGAAGMGGMPGMPGMPGDPSMSGMPGDPGMSGAPAPPGAPGFESSGAPMPPGSP